MLKISRKHYFQKMMANQMQCCLFAFIGLMLLVSFYCSRGRKYNLHSEKATLSSSLEKIMPFKNRKSLRIAKEVSTIYPH